jgi:serine/threonine-protein kinase RsbW
MREVRATQQQHGVMREFVLTGSMAALKPGRDAIMDLVHEHCGDEQVEIDIFLALQEAMANAILHGCHDDPAKLVHCTVEITPTAFEFTIRDSGDGFDSGGAVESAEDGTNLTQHGRGIFLMRSLMDEVTYRHNGTELHLKKLRARL